MNTKTKQTPIQKLAEKYLEWFENKTRDNGESFISLKDDKPAELYELVHSAHNGMMPDDYKYQYVYDSLELLLNYDNPDEIQVSTDVYNGDLIKWIGSNYTRAGYVEEAVFEMGLNAKEFDFFKLLSSGQYMEREEVLGIVRNWLEKIIEGEK